jgi:hypothetical protein
MMATRVRAQPKAGSSPSFTPARSSYVQRKCACGGTPARVELGHDFGRVGVFAGDRTRFTAQDQTQSGGLGEGLTKGVPAASTMTPTTTLDKGTESSESSTPVIDSVELITSSNGAVGGFKEKEDLCDASLNKPGPFTDPSWNGAIANVHQIHFHVSEGWVGNLRALRMVNRTATGRGQSFPESKNDGPPPHEYQFTKDKMVIADAPGWCRTLKESDFPITYSGDFGLYAYDPLNMKILASIAYHVEISKAHFSDPSPVNTVTVTDKKIGSGVKSPVPPKK